MSATVNLREQAFCCIASELVSVPPPIWGVAGLGGEQPILIANRGRVCGMQKLQSDDIVLKMAVHYYSGNLYAVDTSL